MILPLCTLARIFVPSVTLTGDSVTDSHAVHIVTTAALNPKSLRVTISSKGSAAIGGHNLSE